MGCTRFVSAESQRRNLVIAVTVFVCLLGICAVVAALTLTTGGRGRAEPETRIKLIIVAFRHGHRNPTQFLKNDTTHETWAWEGMSQLNAIGKRQSHSLGKFLRQRYGNLIGTKFHVDQIKAHTSSAERCQMTLQAVMAGLFEPQWQPVPYEINDPLLRMYSVQCPHYQRVYRAISDDSTPESVEWLQRERNLTAYVASKSGLNASLSDLADVADNLATMKHRGYPLPGWVTEPDLAGYPPKDMYTDVMQFAEAHQIMCADDEPCARIMAGLWLDQILQIVQKKSAGQLGDRRAHFYATHTETVLSLIRLLKVQGVYETPVSAGFILELVDEPEPAVRFLYHEAEEKNPNGRVVEAKRLAFCKGQDWCPLDTLVGGLANRGFADWKEACQLPQCA